MIPYGRQSISQEDIHAVIEVLRSDFLTQGPTVPKFEKAIADYCGAAHAVAVNSATSALHIACLALGAGPGDHVWTSANTFVASANCARYCGAETDFVDIDPQTYNICPVKLADKLVEAEKSGTLPKIVIPVHIAGQSCDMTAIHVLAQQYGFRVIEDASHAIGGSYQDIKIGACRYCDITIFSFHPVKIITTGEGGMALTNNSELAWKMQLLRSHGITREPDRLENPPEGPWYYEQQMLGFNYRMIDIEAALGLSQMARLDAFVERRNAIARQYDRLLADLPLRIPTTTAGNVSSFHLYVVRTKSGQPGPDHRTVFERLRAAGIGVNLHYMPVYLQPDFVRLGFAPGLCPEAEKYAQSAISIPMFPGLTDETVRETVAALAIAVVP